MFDLQAWKEVRAEATLFPAGRLPVIMAFEMGGPHPFVEELRVLTLFDIPVGGHQDLRNTATILSERRLRFDKAGYPYLGGCPHGQWLFSSEPAEAPVARWNRAKSAVGDFLSPASGEVVSVDRGKKIDMVEWMIDGKIIARFKSHHYLNSVVRLVNPGDIVEKGQPIFRVVAPVDMESPVRENPSRYQLCPLDPTSSRQAMFASIATELCSRLSRVANGEMTIPRWLPTPIMHFGASDSAPIPFDHSQWAKVEKGNGGSAYWTRTDAEPSAEAESLPTQEHSWRVAVFPRARWTDFVWREGSIAVDLTPLGSKFQLYKSPSPRLEKAAVEV